jgi:hypothetical protein
VKIVDPGHKYELASLDGHLHQELTFVKRCDRLHPERYPGNTNAYPGATLQEVMRALIDRLKYVQNQIPCIENRIIISLLRQSIYLLEARAKNRKRKVLKLTEDELEQIEKFETCKKCGHILCNECGGDRP